MSGTTAPYGPIITKVLSGGETGADRAAVDFAIEHGIEYAGWVPLNGWAEDFREAPGLLDAYPHFVATQAADVAVRTTLNVRDSGATLVFTPPHVFSRGVTQTLDIAGVLRRPTAVIDPMSSLAGKLLDEFLAEFRNQTTLNVAGPRESEAPGLYAAVTSLLRGALPYFVTH